MSVCIALGSIFPYLPKEKESIRKLLKTLKEDKDIDVKDMASKIFSKLDWKITMIDIIRANTKKLLLNQRNYL